MTLPCPFCNQSALTFWKRSNDKKIHAVCTGCGCVGPSVPYTPPRDPAAGEINTDDNMFCVAAIAKWNDRPDPYLSSEEIAELQWEAESMKARIDDVRTAIGALRPPLG